MSIGLCYWILMLVWFVFGAYHTWPSWPPASNFMLFILLLLLGWRVFGPPIHG